MQTDPSALPLACPQPGFDSSSSTEDCLSIILYVPSSPAPSSSLPTLLWYVLHSTTIPSKLITRTRIHGGSFIVGSATAPGLDGSNLAVATNSIVAVVQYRLGAVIYSFQYSHLKLIKRHSSVSWVLMEQQILQSMIL